MSFYPIFIPMMGGGGGNPKQLLGIMAATLATAGTAIHYMFSPSFYLDIKKKGDSAEIERHEENFPCIQRVSHYNEDCLIKKGYKIDMTNAYYHRYNRVFIHKKDLDIKQLMADCKECNTYTVIDYEYTPFYSNRECDTSARLNWSACRVRRELK